MNDGSQSELTDGPTSGWLQRSGVAIVEGNVIVVVV